jgi:hypothetical protein
MGEGRRACGENHEAQADKQFTELNTPLEQRAPDARTDEQKQLDKQFPAASPEDTSSAMAIPVKNRR